MPLVIVLGTSGCTVDRAFEAERFPERAKIISEDGIVFGNDLSTRAFDGLCDDPRFNGIPQSDSTWNRTAEIDATDCLKLYRQGVITLK